MMKIKSLVTILVIILIHITSHAYAGELSLGLSERLPYANLKTLMVYPPANVQDFGASTENLTRLHRLYNQHRLLRRPCQRFK